MKQDYWLKQLLVAAVAAFIFMPFIGRAHLFDWDEVNFAECAREMLVSGNYMRVQVDFQPFWEKPPIFIWMQALSMKAFGINEFAARFPNALLGIVTLCTLFHIGRKIASERMAWWWALLYAGSWLPSFYFKSAIIDPAFNFFIFLSFYQAWLMKHAERKWLHALLAGFLLGAAVLTKGPAAILIALLALGVYAVSNKGFSGYKIGYFLLVTLACAATAFLWFGADMVQNGLWFTREFIVYQIRLFRTEDAGHGGPLYYHFLVLLVGCFPAAAFLFQWCPKGKAVRGNMVGHVPETEGQIAARNDFGRWMWVLFWVVLLLFSVVKTKIVHYSSLCYFPLTYLAALQLERLDMGFEKMKKAVWWLNLATGILIALAITLLPLIGIHKKDIAPYVGDKFAVANLEAMVSWSHTECLYGLAYLAIIITTFIHVKRNFAQGFFVLLATQIVMIQLTMQHFVPKVEAYTQGAAVNYYQRFAGKDVYLAPIGYKSYGYLFYSKKMPSANPEYYQGGLQWLLKGNVDKPAYFISKNTDEKDILQTYPQLEKLSDENGYVLYKRR
ncbi:MAG: glycosyltransferase family 39 protein [Edaphocola sp.]